MATDVRFDHKLTQTQQVKTATNYSSLFIVFDDKRVHQSVKSLICTRVTTMVSKYSQQPITACVG